MRYLVLSDIHGNIDALDAVLADAAARYGQLSLLVLVTSTRKECSANAAP